MHIANHRFQNFCESFLTAKAGLSHPRRVRLGNHQFQRSSFHNSLHPHTITSQCSPRFKIPLHKKPPKRFFMVGPVGLEPTASCSQSRRASQLRHGPKSNYINPGRSFCRASLRIWTELQFGSYTIQHYWKCRRASLN